MTPFVVRGATAVQKRRDEFNGMCKDIWANVREISEGIGPRCLRPCRVPLAHAPAHLLHRGLRFTPRRSNVYREAKRQKM